MAPYLALKQPGVTNLRLSLIEAKKNLYSGIAVDLNPTGLPYEIEIGKESENSFSEVGLSCTEWSTNIIGITSDDIECDSEIEAIRKRSENMLREDFTTAEYLLSGSCIIMPLKSGNVTNLARIVTDKMKAALLLVQVPAYVPRVFQASSRTDVNEHDLEIMQADDSWHWWNKFRWTCDFSAKLKVILELNSDDVPYEEDMRRWLGEPLDAVIMPTTMFVRNAMNSPVLDPKWQSTINLLIVSGINFIISAAANDNNVKQYAEYINSLRNSITEQIAPGYEDVLEIPLQPLHDNLSCYTYEVFEQDSTKYDLYQQAIIEALTERVPEEAIKDKLTIIMILGAGRGPLVRSALNASKKTGRKVRIYVIEKNPNAVRTLRNIKEKLWKTEDLHIISKDMREFNPPEQADILVSELLGSFGDNELSPECLDCAVRLLKSDGISIPSKSVSFINPVMSSKIYNAVRTISRPGSLGDDKYSVNRISAESGFVVMLKNVFNIDFPKPLFEFVHPNRSPNIDNSRYGKLKFKASMDAVLHGVAGYFEATLYGNIILSINPLTHTPYMQSWFPMYFPFTQPVQIKQNQEIEIHFWRCVSAYKVWYEWCLVKPAQTHIHNINGLSCPIYLS